MIQLAPVLCCLPVILQIIVLAEELDSTKLKRL
jgi:hypothetical protein